MTDPLPPRRPTDWQTKAMTSRLAGRYRAERWFRRLGLGAVILAAGFLAVLLIAMTANGIGGFMRTDVAVPVNFASNAVTLDPASLHGDEARAKLNAVDLDALALHAAGQAFGGDGALIVSEDAGQAIRDAILASPSIVTGAPEILLPVAPALIEARSGGGDAKARAVLKTLDARGAIHRSFNTGFFTNSDATDPARVGIWGALKGSLLTMFITLILAFPVGVLSALYLEEYAPKNRWTDFIEVSINNLAAVPSVIFGLLGLAVFLNAWNLPRAAPLVGGLTLALMTMPVIVIAGRNAIKAVPPSIRDAALGIGASPVQVVFHHVLPLALPGILTGTIIAMSRALGETAPLLMIGMRMFSASPPLSLSDPATVLPMQIFLWSDEVGRGFIEKTSAAIIVLLVVLLMMNAVAIYFRNRFETRW